MAAHTTTTDDGWEMVDSLGFEADVKEGSVTGVVIAARKQVVNDVLVSSLGGTNYPVCACVCVKRDQVFVVGGGGSGKSGVPNAVSLITSNAHVGLREDHNLVFEHRVQCAAVTNDSSRAYVLAGTQCFEISLTSGLRRLRSFHFSGEPDEGRRCIALNHTNDHLLVSTRTNLTVYQASSGERIRTLTHDAPLHKDSIRDVCFHPLANKACSIDDKTMAVWDISSGKLVSKVTSPERCKFVGCAFSRSGTYVYTVHSSRDGAWVTKWDGEKIVRITQISSEPVTSFALSRQRDLVAVGTSEGTVGVFNVLQPGAIRTNKVHDLGVSTLCFSARGDYVCSGSIDKTIAYTRTLDLCTPAGRHMLRWLLLTMVLTILAITVLLLTV